MTPERKAEIRATFDEGVIYEVLDALDAAEARIAKQQADAVKFREDATKELAYYQARIAKLEAALRLAVEDEYPPGMVDDAIANFLERAEVKP